MKKILVLLFVSLFVLTMAVSVSAVDEINVIIDGKPQRFDVAPQNIDGMILVPLRIIFEEMDASVEWDDDTKTVTASKDETVVKLTVGSMFPTINGKVVTIDHPGIIAADRTLIPLRFAAEAFGGTAEWDIPNNTAIIMRYPIGAPIQYVNERLGFSIELPASWNGKYSIETSAFERNGGIAGAVSFYHNPTIDELGYGGYLFALGRAPGENYTEDDPPIYAGGCQFLAVTGGYTYFINFPSGVEYNEDPDSATASEYHEWTNQIESMLDSFSVCEF